MEIIIELNSEQPLFEQLIEQIRQAVCEGELEAGDPLPPIRQLANDLEVNKKTVARAYKLLERDGIVETRGHRGTWIHRDAHLNCSKDIPGWTHKVLQTVVAELRKTGATDTEIRHAFSNCMHYRPVETRQSQMTV